jgi:hypothetical protein
MLYTDASSYVSKRQCNVLLCTYCFPEIYSVALRQQLTNCICESNVMEWLNNL